jgi:antirestriction protein
MTIKQKFSSIDQSKLTADQKSFLDKIKNVTKNFSDAEMNKKVEQPLDNFIAKAKEKMPEAVKSAPVKSTSKAKSSQTKKPKRTAMSLAKEIRKEGESWNEARARASKMMKEDSKDLSKTVETELDKLSKLVKSAKTRGKLAGISGTDIKRDAVRKAKPRGARRVTHSGETSNQYGTFNNKVGRKYYESRDRHSDRLAPNYPKNAPLLENGAYLTDPTFGNFQNQVFAEGGDIDAFTLRMVKSNGVQPAEMLKEDANVKYARGGFFGTSRPKSALMRDRKNVNHSEDYEVRYSKPRPSRTGYSGNRRFAGGGRVESLTKELHRLKRELDSSRLQTYRLGDVSQEAIDRKKEREVKLARFNEVLKELRETDEKFALGGTVVTDLAGHTGGGTGGLNAGMPLNGFSNTSYTGLVGETGAMSSGEMFMNGGGLPEFSQQYYIVTEALGNPAQHFNKGGSITNERKHVNHNEDYEVRYAKPRPHRKGYKGVRGFNKGGSVTNERKHVNHDEDYEVRYSKPRPSRKGYKGARKFMAGGSMETPRIYVADLEAYNSGRLVGEWLDLADYDNADELMDAIQDVLKKSGGEEYAIHDVEYVPRSMYSEYMGQRDFEELYKMMDLAKENDLPLEVVQDVVSQYDEMSVREFVGKYDSAVDFAQELVDDLGGIQNFNDFQYYLDISETDRRLLSQEMADSYAEDIRDEDGGNRLIEEAGLNLDEYENADEKEKDELLDLAQSMVSDEYYDTWYEGLNDPYYFLVEEQGMYSAEDFANANFIRVDYEKLADALDQDYTIIEYDGDVYVFNIR